MPKIRPKANQQIRIGDDIVIVVENGSAGRGPSVCIDAPRHISIDREARTIWPGRKPGVKGGAR